MGYIIGLVAFIVGLLLDRFLSFYFSEKGRNLATKEDIGQITREIEKVKNIFNEQRDLSKTEREFYEGMTANIYKFLAKVKKYEFENKPKLVTREIVLADEALKLDFFEFLDAANEFIGKSFVFLREENYLNLKGALCTEGSFPDLANNLLYAMRKSLHPDTMLHPKGSLKEFSY